MKYFVTEEAVRQFVREAMSNPDVGWESHSDLAATPVAVSSVVDPSAAITDPVNTKFKPRTRMELKPAISAMIDASSDDEAIDIYDTIRNALKSMKSEEDEMNKSEKKTEAVIRATVRKMLDEAAPYRDTGMSYSGPMVGGSRAAVGHEECETCEGEGYLPDNSKCKACGGTGEVKVTKGKYEKFDEEGGMMTLEDMAKELGYANAQGVRAAIERALKKARHVMGMDPDELEVLTLTAMEDYIEELRSSGELTAADVQLLRDHPNIVSELDGFRSFLDSYIKKTMKSQ